MRRKADDIFSGNGASSSSPAAQTPRGGDNHAEKLTKRMQEMETTKNKDIDQLKDLLQQATMKAQEFEHR